MVADDSARRELLKRAAWVTASLAGWVPGTVPQARAGSRMAPEPAPEFNLPIQGKPGATQSLVALRGRVVLLNFWATWCVPCRREFPALSALATELAAAGLTVLAINIEDGDADEAVTDFLAVARPAFPVLRDADMRLAGRMRIPGMPATFLVDRRGQLRWKHGGYQPGDEEQYRLQCRHLLEEPS